jgi:hypothetical protein
MGPGFRQEDDEDGSRFKLSHHAVSSPAHAGDPVFQRRLCLSREAALYWIARSRLRQGFDEATNPWHAEALAKAASRAMTVWMGAYFRILAT